MKINIRKAVLSSACAASLFLALSALSCGTTKNLETETPQDSSQNSEIKSQEIQNENQIPQVKEPTAAELYKSKTDGITLSLVSYPGEITKGKEFSKPYLIHVSDKDGNSVPNFEIAVQTPFDSQKTVISTDENGNASYLPPSPQKSSNSEIKFYPEGDLSDSEIAEEAKKLEISAPYKVQTNMKSAGGVIAVVDFSKTEKPITSNPVSSSNLLMSLMKLGFTRIGNIDLTNDVLKDDTAALQRKAKSMVGNTAVFLIYGTVKFKSVDKNDDGTTTVNLTGKIKALDLKTGEILFEKERDSSVNAKNEYNALTDARKNLAADFAQDLKYGI